jgi:hypothetical protein
MAYERSLWEWRKEKKAGKPLPPPPALGIMYEDKAKEKHNLSIVKRVGMILFIEITS